LQTLASLAAGRFIAICAGGGSIGWSVPVPYGAPARFASAGLGLG
jgi:hypothetical protein